MADDWERTFSESETEAIEAAIDDSDEDVRYSLRSRKVSKSQTMTTGALMSTAADGVGRSHAGTDTVRGSAADPGNRSGNGTCVVDVRLHDVNRDERNTDVEDVQTGGRMHRHSVLVGQDLIEGSSAQGTEAARSTDVTRAGAALASDERSRLSGNPGTSPFELMSALGSGTSTRVSTTSALVVGRTYPYASGGMRVNHGGAPRVDLPFQFNRSDIPYVPSYIGVSRTLPPAGAYATRMTAREQERDVRNGGREGRPRIEEGMLWSDHHRILEEQNLAGALAIERIARSAAGASDEPDIYPDPHPLLDGGSAKADRIGPDSSIFGLRRPPNRVGADVFDTLMSQKPVLHLKTKCP